MILAVWFHPISILIQCERTKIPEFYVDFFENKLPRRFPFLDPTKSKERSAAAALSSALASDAMSFLLLKSKRSRPPPPAPTGTGGNRSFPRAPVGGGRPSAPMPGGGRQTQQLLQRQRPAPAQGGVLRQSTRQTKQSSQMQQQVTRGTNAQKQAKVESVISMEEGEFSYSMRTIRVQLSTEVTIAGNSIGAVPPCDLRRMH